MKWTILKCACREGKAEQWEIDVKHKQMNRTKSDEWISVRDGWEGRGAWDNDNRLPWWQLHSARTHQPPCLHIRMDVYEKCLVYTRSTRKHFAADFLFLLIKRRWCRHLINGHVAKRPHASTFNQPLWHNYISFAFPIRQPLWAFTLLVLFALKCLSGNVSDSTSKEKKKKKQHYEGQHKNQH